MSISTVANRVIELAVTIQAPPERVFAAFTEQALLESWFVRRADVDPRPGGVFGCYWSKEHVIGRFTAVEPSSRIVIEFDERPVADGETVLALTFTPAGAGTHVRFLQSGFPEGPGWDELLEGMREGWPRALDDLSVLLETGAPVENGFRHV